MSKDQVKASWDLKTTKVFIDLCIELVQQGERKGTSLTKKAWGILADKFNAKTGRAYTKPQFKNKYDSLRKEWQTWDRLLHETGLRWDIEKNTVSAIDDWWEKKLVEVPNYKKFRKRGLQFRDELTQLFGSVTTTEPQLWALSPMTLLSEGAPNDDMEEGFGDNSEILGTSTGISGEFYLVTFNENSGGSRGNIGIRQDNNRGDRPGSSLGIRRKSEAMKKKPTFPIKISDALSRIAKANGSDFQRGNDMVSQAQARRLEEKARAYETSIMGVLSHLKTIDEVFNDIDLFTRCTRLLMERPEAREMYAALKDRREQLVAVLKHFTKNL
ncbi:uncharacterized protein LOC114747572 [Neltuma alba]|uniref:uncharacterized protein LOC114747572 n=1 Tax=Neltuma alba TaxID=207710 RepID=UPI0010A33F23|nr:uncharacterized protein LOC114747572 [Prosopis alba]